MGIQKVYYVPNYLTDEACCAYFGEDYNFYEGNAFDYSRDKIRGCVTGQNYEYIQKFPYMDACEDFTYPLCTGYILKNERWYKGCIDIYKVDETKDGRYCELVGDLVPGEATDSRGIRRRGYDIHVWKPEYAGWAWVGFTDGIPAVGAAYVLLMREDEFFWDRKLYCGEKCWKAGEPKPSGTPEIGTRFRWRDDRF